MRCSSVSRLDQVLLGRYLRGSGFPIPENGSRMIACASSSARSDVFRLVFTQYFRSSINSGWNTATHSRGGEALWDLLFFLAKVELSSEVLDC